MGREDNDLRPRGVRRNPPKELQAVHARHGEVQHDEGGLGMGLQGPQRLPAIRGFPDADETVPLPGHQGAESHPDEGLVVDDENAAHAFRSPRLCGAAAA